MNKKFFFSKNLFGSSIFEKRIFVLYSIIIFLVFCLIIYLFFLQIISFNEYKNRSDRNRIKFILIEPKRGVIYDYYGIPLALNKTVYRLELIPNKIKNLHKTVSLLRNIVYLSDNDIMYFYNKVRCMKYNFISIPIKLNLTDLQKSSFSVNQHHFPGVFIRSYQIRYYPYGEIFSHVIGYVSKSKYYNVVDQLYDINDVKNFTNYFSIGKCGIESYYNNVLSGIPGYEAIEVNNKGSVTRTLYKKFPISGYDIRLTLDVSLQKYIHGLLKDNTRSSVVVSNPNNGEIRALISNPSYNPNLFVHGISKNKFSSLLKDKNSPFINRVTQGLYPPASTVKPYMLLFALKLGIIKKNFFMFDNGCWKLPKSNKCYRDWKRYGHGLFDIITALEESVDTLFYQLAFNIGIDTLSKCMEKFGYGHLTGIDLNEEYSGIMPTREWKKKIFNKPWYKGDTIPIGIGQGYWVATPIQMLKSLMILVNNGDIITPHLCYSINTRRNEHDIFYNQKKFVKIKNISPEYFNIVKYGMYAAANNKNGTAYNNFYNSTYKAAVKSGTAQVYNLRENEIYNVHKVSEKLRDHKLMVAFAPFDNPIISTVVVLENSNMDLHVGKITRKILDYILLNFEKN
ncbi:MAG: peptidoglycan DD-transpeptidase MrdA [Candidatus Westeberhardia cardiocondylae]|nr:peptidoglycan DD-transpeptidase MrdA [Candidatus Westeberhardia cardiocondylae]